MIRHIDQETCNRWDKLLEEFDPSEHAGGAWNPYTPGWYWFDLDTPRGPFATRRLAQQDQDQEQNYQAHPDDQVIHEDTPSLDDLDHPFSPANVKRELGE